MITTIFFVALYILTIFRCGNSEGIKDNEWLKPGKCKGKWRPEKLPGRCTGLSTYKHFPELKDVPEITNATTCRALCCNMGDQCSSWQYEVYSRECRLGPVMRLGNENAGVPGWCEPFAPVKWNGKRLESRDTATGKVTWSDEKLETQCFGLGDERKNPTDKKSRMNTQECEDACAKDPECEIWQEYPGRGCFYFHKAGVHCDEKKISRYEGGRKCLPGYCGGMEEQLLGIKVDDEMIRQTRTRLGIKRRRTDEEGEGQGGGEDAAEGDAEDGEDAAIAADGNEGLGGDDEGEGEGGRKGKGRGKGKNRGGKGGKNRGGGNGGKGGRGGGGNGGKGGKNRKQGQRKSRAIE